LGVVSAMAQTSSTAPYSGDIWHRSTLTGDWGGISMNWLQRALPLI
jgi:hypothetical protein